MGNLLDGKVAIITGGSRGMGEAHARAIVSNGGKVVIGDILDSEGERLAEELGPDDAIYVRLDVTSEKDWAAAVAMTLEVFGKLNVLVNNAGISNAGPLGKYGRTQWDKVIAVNLTGPFLGLTASLEALKAARPSSVINVSSAAAFRGQAAIHGYVASKWGLRGFTKSAAIELAEQGVRVNSVHPGLVKTPIIGGLDFSGNQGPMGRPGLPEEVANMIVYLASDLSSYSTGAEFLVDGGNTAGFPAVPGTDK